MMLHENEKQQKQGYENGFIFNSDSVSRPVEHKVK